MKRTITIFAISAVLLNAISASLTKDEKWKRLQDMDCNYQRVDPSGFNFWAFADLSTVLNARPPGYRLKLHIILIGIKLTELLLISKEDAFLSWTKPRYSIDIGLTRKDKIMLYRLEDQNRNEYDFDLPAEDYTGVPTDLLIAITNNGTITLTIDGKKLFTHHDDNTFPINHFRFGALDPAEIYYNCTSKHNDTLSQE